MDDLVGRYGLWKCASCASEKLATAHQRRQKYCSRSCYSKEKPSNVIGQDNPNYRGGCSKTCNFCGGTYESYVKGRKFCSKKCHVGHIHASKKVGFAKPKKEAQKKSCAYCHILFKCNKSSSKTTCSPSCSSMLKVSKETIQACAMCGANFKSFLSQKRKYCSYKCHLDSGGAFRAGMAAKKATMKYGPKKDANHNELMLVIRKHCAVYDVSTSGMGIPDGLAWINGAWHLFDIKNPQTGYGKRGLNPTQKKWLSQDKGGPIYLLYTIEDAEKFATGNFDGLKFEVPSVE